MPKKLTLAVSGFVLCLLLTAAAYFKGRNDVLVNDFKTYHANLIGFDQVSPDAEFKDYLKARYYYFANRVPKDVLAGSDKDYGPVSTNALRGLTIGKGPTTPQEEYRKFKELTKELHSNQ
jgi:hypothetical protein